MANEEQTIAAAEDLESTQQAEDPDKSPPREDEYFQGLGLHENIFKAISLKRSQPPPTIRQQVAEAPASASMSMPVTTVPAAKVIASDMLTLASKPGLLNPLNTAPETSQA